MVTRQWVAGEFETKPQKQEGGSEVSLFRLGDPLRKVVAAPLVAESKITPSNRWQLSQKGEARQNWLVGKSGWVMSNSHHSRKEKLMFKRW